MIVNDLIRQPRSRPPSTVVRTSSIDRSPPLCRHILALNQSLAQPFEYTSHPFTSVQSAPRLRGTFAPGEASITFHGLRSPGLSTKAPGPNAEMLSAIPKGRGGSHSEPERALISALLSEHASQQADQGWGLSHKTSIQGRLETQIRVSEKEFMGIVSVSRACTMQGTNA